MSNVQLVLQFDEVADAHLMLTFYRILQLRERQNIGRDYHDKDIVQAIGYLFDVLGDFGGDESDYSAWINELSDSDKRQVYKWLPGIEKDMRQWKEQ